MDFYTLLKDDLIAFHILHHFDLNTTSFDICIYDIGTLKLIEFRELFLPWCRNTLYNTISKTSFTRRQTVWRLVRDLQKCQKRFMDKFVILFSKSFWHMYHFILVWPTGLHANPTWNRKCVVSESVFSIPLSMILGPVFFDALFKILDRNTKRWRENIKQDKCL